MVLPGEGGDDLGDDPHGRQYHDVYGRMRIDPEEVLVEHRVASAGPGSKMPGFRGSRSRMHQEQGDAHHRGGQDLDPRRGVEAPHQQGQAVPGHARRPQAVYGGDEVQPREDRRPPQDEGRHDGQHDVHVRGGAVGGVEGPSRIDTPEDHGEDDAEPAHDVEVP